MRAIRRLLTVALLLLCSPLIVAEDAAPSGEARGDADDVRAARTFGSRFITDDLREGVSRGLARLAELQDSNGSFTRGGNQSVQIAITSLSGLAFLASGSTVDKGPYSTNVRRAMNYLLSMQDANTGYITGDGSRIHGHGYASLFLAQLYGSLENREEKQRVQQALRLAVNCIQNGQTQWGGWGYVPSDITWDEGSTTVCVMQALRAASDAGINVRRETIQMAIRYLYDSAERRTFTHKGEEMVGYTFKYSLASGWNSDSYALCAAAISTMNAIGIYAEGATWDEHAIGRVYQGGLNWLRYRLDDFLGRRSAGQSGLDVSHFYYAHFYAAQAMWNAPEEAYFDEYFPPVRDLLLNEQRRNPQNTGGWPTQSYGEAYTTAFALLILQVPYQLLPLYAR
jgi:hypothetical protein